MAAPRTLWKGAISFGLVHIPVALYPASRQERIDFDWLDKRSMQPVGYRRINKETGKEIDKENIVKGIKGDDDSYVLMSDDEIKAAYPKTTQTIEIESFVPVDQIPFFFFDTPYYLAPIGRGEKVYALLRDTMAAEGVVGVAKLVIQTKQHLAALIPAGGMLMVNTLRWASEIRSAEELSVPSEGTKLSPKEREMAKELVADMRGDWDPKEFRDAFRDEILALAAKKVKAGQSKQLNVTSASEEPQQRSADIVDLTELLKRSLKGKGRGAPSKDKAEKPAEDAEEEAPPRSKKAAPRRAAKTPARSDGKTHAKAAPAKTASKAASSRRAA
jgi:DNA end-binding protein Ku